jgi:hypothetical protein
LEIVLSTESTNFVSHWRQNTLKFVRRRRRRLEMNLELPYKIQYAGNDVAGKTCSGCINNFLSNELVIAEMIQVSR